ncbi:MAG TPA: hypothetical protein VJ925_07845 [Longimicrobiales bacterium]|nr:hypothetical protein [Longimicrobiales bacterium]
MGSLNTKPTGSRRWWGPLLAVALLSSACGALPQTSRPFPGTEPTATVVVDNLVSGYVGMVVTLSSTAGPSRRLGSVSTAGDTRFEVRDISGGEYYLEGRLAGRTPLRSPTFIFGDGDSVEWNLSDNRISYR